MYTIGQVAKLAGISLKTLRYYDQIGLLEAKRSQENGYRYYDDDSLDQLQIILYYKRLQMPLDQIQAILKADDVTYQSLLEAHLKLLEDQARQIQAHIATINQSIQAAKGEIKMTQAEKFENLKKEQIQANEAQYGQEIRAKYGDQEVDAFNKMYQNLSQEDMDRLQTLNEEIASVLKEGVSQSPHKPEIASQLAQKHREWLSFYVPKTYNLDRFQVNMVDMYLADDRFKAYYDNIIEGGCQYLHDAVHAFHK